jgi:hypothetical protein
MACSLVACGAPSTSGDGRPEGSAWLKFDDLFGTVCDANICPGATRVIVAGVSDVAMSRAGDATLVGLTLRSWWLHLDCSNTDGCISTWELKSTPACYSVSGTKVTASTGCPTAAPLLPASTVKPWVATEHDALAESHSVMRAFFGVENENPLPTLAAGRGSATRWWGDLTVSPLLQHEYWGLGTFSGASTPMLAVFATDQATPTLQYLLPAPDGAPVMPRTSATASDAVYWSDRSDTVLALDVTDTRLLGRRVRKAITTPQTSTVGVLEAGDQVFTLVLTPSTTTLSGSGAGPVVEVSLVTSTALQEAEAPVLPFSPISVHTPNTISLVICFSEPLDDGALSVAQFESDGALQLLSVANDVVPQCARLLTSPQSREQRYHLTVKGLTSRSGAVLKEALVSATPDDTAQGSPISLVPTLEGVLPSSYLPTAGGYLAASGPVFGVVDHGGVTFHHFESSPAPAPTLVTVRPDAAAGGVWVNFSTGTTGVLTFDEPSGASTTWTQTDLPAALLVNSGFLEPVGDGSVLLFPKVGGGLVRLKKGATAEQLSLVDSVNFRGLERRSHDVLTQDATTHRLTRVTLPAAVGATSFAAPTSSSSLPRGPACETQGVLYWCTGVELFRLGDVATPSLGSCRDLSADPSGDCWATAANGQLTRLRGATQTTVTLPNPLDAGVPLSHPEFVGDTVFLLDRQLRVSVTDWASLAGSVP